MLYYENDNGKLYNGDWISELDNIEDNSIDCIVTSPPYWKLRQYFSGEEELGQEEKFEYFVDNLVKGFNNIKPKLKSTATVFINIGDTFSGKLEANTDKKKKQTVTVTVNKPKTQYMDKCLLMIPERFALEMIDNGWVLRNKIIWNKPNQTPYAQSDGLSDRFTCSYEYIYFFTLQNKGYNFITQYEKAVEGTRIMRDVWSINTEALKGDHPAVFPPELVRRCIEAGCPEGGIVFDPFAGSMTTLYVAQKLHRKWLGIELNVQYCEQGTLRLKKLKFF